MSEKETAYKMAIEQSQEILRKICNPEPSITAEECVSELLGVLDNQDLIRLMREPGLNPE